MSERSTESEQAAQSLRSELNLDVKPAAPGEFAPLKLGPLTVDPPVVLAPMAGVTNVPFRTVCRRFSKQRCLYVSEMITARSFAIGHEKTLKLAAFGDEEPVKSIQLYGTHPTALARAAATLRDEWDVDHIDMNFGCPVRKVTANGGGSAIPARPRLMARLVRAVKENAGAIPVTVKFRVGIDEDVITYLDAGRVAEAEGCSAVALHARTAAQLYSGDADWSAISRLKEAVTSIPVLGNGDIFESWDALRMMRATGCDGVVVGRGCLGRPWLFAELCSVFDGDVPDAPPDLGTVIDTALEHARLPIESVGERAGMQQMRKFAGWYVKSFPGTKPLMPELHRVCTLDELATKLGTLPRDTPYPLAGLRARRAKTGRTQDVALPDGYLNDRETDEAPTIDPFDAGNGG